MTLRNKTSSSKVFKENFQSQQQEEKLSTNIVDARADTTQGQTRSSFNCNSKGLWDVMTTLTTKQAAVCGWSVSQPIIASQSSPVSHICWQISTPQNGIRDDPVYIHQSCSTFSAKNVQDQSTFCKRHEPGSDLHSVPKNM